MYVYKISNIQPSSCTILESAALGVPTTVRIKSKKPLSKKQVIDKVNKYLMENYNESIDPADFESVKKPAKTIKKATILEMADDDIDPLGLGIDEAGNQLGDDEVGGRFNDHIRGGSDLSDMDNTDEFKVEPAADDESSFGNTGTLDEFESGQAREQADEVKYVQDLKNQIAEYHKRLNSVEAKVNRILHDLLNNDL